jgi:hypothetical protein
VRVGARDDQHLPADSSFAATAAAAMIGTTAAHAAIAAAAAAAGAIIGRSKVRVRLLQQEVGVREGLGKGGVAAAAAAAQRQSIQPRPHVGGAVAPVRALHHCNAAWCMPSSVVAARSATLECMLYAAWHAAVARPAPCCGARVLALTRRHCWTGVEGFWHLKGLGNAVPVKC